MGQVDSISVRLSRLSRNAILSFLERLREDDACDQYLAEQALKKGVEVANEDDNALFEKYWQQEVRQRARVCATYALAGILQPWAPYPVVARSTLEGSLTHLFSSGEIPSYEDVEGCLRRCLGKDLDDVRVRCELFYNRWNDLSSFAWALVAVGNRPPTRMHEYEGVGWGVRRVKIQFEPGSESADYIEVVVDGRCARAAREPFASWVAQTIRTCTAVCDHHFAATAWMGPGSPIGREETGAEDRVSFEVGPLFLSRGEDLDRLFRLVTLVLGPSPSKSQDGGLVAESVLKSGIWVMGERSAAPFGLTGFANYLAVFENCLKQLYKKQPGESVGDFCIRALRIEDSDQKRIVHEIFASRNRLLHELDPKVLPIQVVLAWELARCGLKALAVKLIPFNASGEGHVHQPGGVRPFDLREKVLARLESVGGEWVQSVAY